MDALSLIQEIREINPIRLIQIAIRNVDYFRVEGLTYLIADQVIDSLHIQFGCQPCLYTVDDGEFSSAVFGNLEQTLGFVEEPRVFEGNAHAVGESLQETDIRIVEGVRGQFCHRNPTHELIADQQWHDDVRVVWCRSADICDAPLCHQSLGIFKSVD